VDNHHFLYVSCQSLWLHLNPVTSEQFQGYHDISGMTGM